MKKSGTTSHHFIPTTPADTKFFWISRTIGADRVVDEMLFCFTQHIDRLDDSCLKPPANMSRFRATPALTLVFDRDKRFAAVCRPGPGQPACRRAGGGIIHSEAHARSQATRTMLKQWRGSRCG
jgi:hypothetical protein